MSRECGIALDIADLVVVCCAPIAEGVVIPNDDAIRDVGWVAESGPVLQSDRILRSLPRCPGLPNFVPERLAIPSQWENETAQGAACSILSGSPVLPLRSIACGFCDCDMKRVVSLLRELG